MNTPRRKEKEGRTARGRECARSVASALYGPSAPTHGRSGECQRHAWTEVESVRDACETRVRRPITEKERVRDVHVPVCSVKMGRRGTSKETIGEGGAVMCAYL